MTNKSAPSSHAVQRRLLILLYDMLAFVFVLLLLLGIGPSAQYKLPPMWVLIHGLLAAFSILLCRYIARVYNQVWRYGGAGAYIRLILSDICAGVLYYLLQLLPFIFGIEYIRVMSLVALNLLSSIGLRLIYHYLYEHANRQIKLDGVIWKLLGFLTGNSIAVSRKEAAEQIKESTKTRIAIVGAGRIGAMLADELKNNPHSRYTPCFFVDIDRDKIGRSVVGLPVYSDDERIVERLADAGATEVVFALPNHLSAEYRKGLYERYRSAGVRVRVYDYPVMQSEESGKRKLRDFDIAELLFRDPVEIGGDIADAYYRDKVILITGGGGSIGSELCRQIAKMHPRKLVIADICENGAYDIQQELRFIYRDAFAVDVEIVSVCDCAGLEKVFAAHHPNVVLHAAAHKHVPLMERNCCEAVKNNVFGTLNAVELAKQYEAERFIMVSTDKAVNPTNVMGATKRVCEMIVCSHAGVKTSTAFSATRFGNVLGSAGSVIPLFRRQIMLGGPITLTDRRIIRYFMTIPEAAQLVLQSGAMAKDGELFVLDMGEPVKILDLAENMIRLAGYEPYEDIDIVETGLREGEKLYEELLIRTEELDKTENRMIFIERDAPLSWEELTAKLDILRRAVATERDDFVKAALKEVVPTFREPEEVNAEVERRMSNLQVL